MTIHLPTTAVPVRRPFSGWLPLVFRADGTASADAVGHPPGE
ncbi:hypothetical protein I545_3173 [Mycobacterium kansasii 662]|uniref:Uncharacterized protein n=3 Tax=Mycobacterium kansasii TaxID=1768 RepID=A0A1V3XMU4_MYCKA|nr:hypothetical protein MKAN_09065 [Mycobacterium kansasii ATCC 12478]EUA01925.1 hypothetical protein I547_3262 [Mycobacterium kansasii 824]EUA18011.1 hypothetical protein I545_3173 [Mycobacterium kansasii 662]KEP39604.1 hypothetical protein MKSMC1_52770 [Mycobacterium kansasii]OOK80547.1 hypothetical protein BZL29_2886 [Mycobacterium kansasii]